MWARLNITFSILWAIGIAVGLVMTIVGPPVPHQSLVKRAEQDRRDNPNNTPDDVRTENRESGTRREPSADTAGPMPRESQGVEFGSLRNQLETLDAKSPADARQGSSQ